MMKRVFVFILALWFNHFAFAQGQKDSVKVHLQKYALSKKDNGARFRLFVALSGDYRRNNYDSAVFYGKKALKLAKQTGTIQEEIEAEQILEFSLRETGNLAEALNLQLHVVDEARLLKNIFIEGIALNSIGNTYLEMGDPTTALEYYRRSRNIFLPMADTAGIKGRSEYPVSGYWKRNEASNMGNSFEKLNQLDSALRYETALYHDRLLPPDLMPELLSRLGNLQERLGKEKEAMQLFRKGIILSFTVNTVNDRATIYYQMAVFV
jgi:tetratricopeptide (TPR) repeat protein